MTEQPRVKIACPECGGPLPLEAANVAVKCAQCGHVSAPIVERHASTVELPCPRCRTSLFRVDAHGVPLLGCGVCGGIFLDNDGSTRITRAKDSLIATLAERARGRAIAMSIDTRPKDLPCPACSAPMKRVLARGFVEIDFCSAHGTWFDGGEVNRVMDAYAPRPSSVDTDAASRAAAELRMAAFRESQSNSIERDEFRSAVGASGVTVAVLGILGALVGVSDS